MHHPKDRIKLAIRIEQALVRLNRNRHLQILNHLAGLETDLSDLATFRRRIQRAIDRGWLMAAEQCRQRLRRILYDLPYQVSRVASLAQEEDHPVPNLAFILEELGQIEREFGGYSADVRMGLLVVTTDPIELDGTYLGPFEIQLDLAHLPGMGRRPTYNVIATEPHPATSNEHVTHPHVSDGNLCEGDGGTAITAALEQGRLCDFFQLVVNILSTYNPDSAYISLDKWDGVSCHDCGYTTDPDDSYTCQFCESNLCSECAGACSVCDTTGCSDCLGHCPDCEAVVCDECRDSCSECSHSGCKSCLEDGLCPECKEKQDEDQPKEEQQTEQVAARVGTGDAA